MEDSAVKQIASFLVSVAFLCAVPFTIPAYGETPSLTPFQLLDQGRFEEAAFALERNLATGELTAAQREQTYALLGYAYQELGNYTQSRQEFERAFRMLKADGNRPDEFPSTLLLYADLMMSTGDADAAAKALSDAAKVCRRTANHAALTRIYTKIAEYDVETRKFKKAGKALASAQSEIAQISDGADRFRPAIDQASAWLAISTGNVHDAIQRYATALAEYRTTFGEHNMHTGWVYLLLGHAQQTTNDLTAARENMEQGLAILEVTAGPESIRYLRGQLAYANLLDGLGLHDEASRIETVARHSMQSFGRPQCGNCTVSLWSLRH